MKLVYVAAVLPLGEGPIKIGSAAVPQFRVQSLREIDPRIQLIAVVSGGSLVESVLHRLLEQSRSGNGREWYNPTESAVLMARFLMSISVPCALREIERRRQKGAA